MKRTCILYRSYIKIIMSKGKRRIKMQPNLTYKQKTVYGLKHMLQKNPYTLLEKKLSLKRYRKGYNKLLDHSCIASIYS